MLRQRTSGLPNSTSLQATVSGFWYYHSVPYTLMMTVVEIFVGLQDFVVEEELL